MGEMGLIDQGSTMDSNEFEEVAYKLGKEAHGRGQSAVPSRDSAFKRLFDTSMYSPFVNCVYTAWLKGWHIANKTDLT